MREWQIALYGDQPYAFPADHDLTRRLGGFAGDEILVVVPRSRLEAVEQRMHDGWAAHSASFGALLHISLLTPLGGEVAEYSDVVEAVRTMADKVEAVEKERDEWKAIAREVAQTLASTNHHMTADEEIERARLLLRYAEGSSDAV